MKRFLLAAAGVMALSSMTINEADARERFPRWYVGLNGAYAIHPESRVDGTSTDYDFDEGLGFSASLGYKPHTGNAFFDNTRYEAEFMFAVNDIDRITTSGVSASSSGDIKNGAVMLNAIYDFNNASRVTPYLGVGIGGADVELGGVGNDSVFAYQFKAGMSYAPELMPFVDFSLGYRYFRTSDPNIGGVEIENSLHNVELGARFNF